jgi:hypothetical protein
LPALILLVGFMFQDSVPPCPVASRFGQREFSARQMQKP